MALAQYVAGMGFSNVGLGIDHSMAHTLSAHYDTPHGVACAMLLPIAMEFNKPVVVDRLADVARAMGVDTTSMSTEEAADAAIAAVRQLSEDVEIPKRARAWSKAISSSWHAMPWPTRASLAIRAKPTMTRWSNSSARSCVRRNCPCTGRSPQSFCGLLLFSMYSDARYSLRLACSFSSRQISSYISSITLCGTSPKKLVVLVPPCANPRFRYR